MSDSTRLLVSALAGAAVAAGISYMSNLKSNEKKGIEKKGPFYEYSVVYTDRVYNLMSPPFQETMKDISASMKAAYNADAFAMIPGSGTYGMEAVASQFGRDKKCLVIRNGYFSFRWTDIFAVTKLASSEVVLKARPVSGQEGQEQPQIAPMPIDEVIASILAERPAVVFAPHTETSTGVILSPEYIKAVADATHEVGGLFVLDGIAAGTVWVDMRALGIDVYISAPQKGWTGPACVGLVMMSNRARQVMRDSPPPVNGFCCNLAQWTDVVEKYDNADGSGPGFRYYTTLPTDALMTFRDVIKENERFGLANCQAKAEELGGRIRAALASRGFRSTAADGWASPGVVVVYSPVPGMVGQFKKQGIQVAGGVPWKLGEEQYSPKVDSKTSTFRVGLFGLDKLRDVDTTVTRFEQALDRVLASSKL